MARRGRRRRRSGGTMRHLRVLVVLVLYAALARYAIEHPMLVGGSLVGSASLVLVTVVGRRWCRRRARLRQTRTLVGLLTLSPADFERAIGEIFTALGYERLRRVGGTGDLGVDLAGRDPDGRVVIVQCKRYGLGNRVGSPAIQSFLGMIVHHGAERGIFVTTSDYTAPAIDLARSATVPITLIDGREITRLTAHARGGTSRG